MVSGILDIFLYFRHPLCFIIIRLVQNRKFIFMNFFEIVTPREVSKTRKNINVGHLLKTYKIIYSFQKRPNFFC